MVSFLYIIKTGADPIKLFFFTSEEFLKFIADKLECLVRMIKNVSTIKWPSLTAKIGKQRKKSFIGSAPALFLIVGSSNV